MVEGGGGGGERKGEEEEGGGERQRERKGWKSRKAQRGCLMCIT